MTEPKNDDAQNTEILNLDDQDFLSKLEQVLTPMITGLETSLLTQLTKQNDQKFNKLAKSLKASLKASDSDGKDDETTDKATTSTDADNSLLERIRELESTLKAQTLALLINEAEAIGYDPDLLQMYMATQSEEVTATKDSFYKHLSSLEKTPIAQKLKKVAEDVNTNVRQQQPLNNNRVPTGVIQPTGVNVDKAFDYASIFSF